MVATLPFYKYSIFINYSTNWRLPLKRWAVIADQEIAKNSPVRVLVDVHLPKRLVEILSAHVIESKHTLDLHKMNATPDHEIIQIADLEDQML